MFETDLVTRLAKRRLARCAFGLALIAGAAVFVLNAFAADPFPAATTLGAIWLLAGSAAGLGYAFDRPAPLDVAQRLFVPSIVLPSIGLALILPLTIQMPFVIGAYGSAAFDDWVPLSIWITGAVHIVLATLAALRGEMLVNGTKPLSVSLIYYACIGVACLPFAVFVLPPFLVALTGLPILPLLHYQARLVERERAMVATPFMPRAMVLT